MGKHEKFDHPHVTGETDPVKIKKEMDRIQAENDREMDRIRNERSKGDKK